MESRKSAVRKRRAPSPSPTLVPRSDGGKGVRSKKNKMDKADRMSKVGAAASAAAGLIPVVPAAPPGGEESLSGGQLCSRRWAFRSAAGVACGSLYPVSVGFVSRPGGGGGAEQGGQGVEAKEAQGQTQATVTSGGPQVGSFCLGGRFGWWQAWSASQAPLAVNFGGIFKLMDVVQVFLMQGGHRLCMVAIYGGLGLKLQVLRC